MSHTTIKLHTNPTDILWADTPDGDYARRYLSPLMQHGTQTFINNVHAELAVLRLDDLTIPITTAAYRPDNCYVVSPYNHYLVYSLEEVDKLKNPPAENAIRAALRPLQLAFMSAQFDRVVFVNNWLLSTNLWVDVTPAQIQTMLAFLIERFPDHAIVFRSIDAYGNLPLLETLTQAGCDPVFSRKVYYQHMHNAQRTRDYKNDLRLYRQAPYEIIDGENLSDADIPRLITLYNKLYLDKYSMMNPHFNADFFRLLLENDLMTFRAFRHEGRIDAVMGYFRRRGIMTQPIFGYDTDLPQKTGLYRLLSMQVLMESARQGVLINASAGVGRFKRLRGGIPINEYNVVYQRHLPYKRRWTWHLLKGIANRIAIPVIDRNEF